MSIAVIKYIALILMTIDHIGKFFPTTPIWLRYVGRVAAPLFFFAASEGIYHTHDRKKYLIGLYKFSILMRLLELIFSLLFGKYMTTPINNDIFASIMHGCLIVYILEENKDDSRKRNLYLLGYVLWQFIVTLICYPIHNSDIAYPFSLFCRTLFTVLGSYIYSAEGAFYLSMMIVLFYLCRNSKKATAVAYIAYCMAYAGMTILRVPYRVDQLIAGMGAGTTVREIVRLPFEIVGFHIMESMAGVPILQLAFRYHYQWMMVFALPMILAYNGKRGEYPKMLFYVYYPAHLFALALLSIVILS